MSDCEFIVNVLALFDLNDEHSLLYWRVDPDNRVRFFVNVNDVFFWGAADLEEITPQNLAALESAFTDAKAIDRVDGEMEAANLFTARLRKLRPQGAAYPENEALWPLFDACGPERETGFGNPYKAGEYQRGGNPTVELIGRG